MKAKMIEFIFKRLGSKFDDLRNYDDIDGILDDIDVYMEQLKELLVDVAL